MLDELHKSKVFFKIDLLEWHIIKSTQKKMINEKTLLRPSMSFISDLLCLLVCPILPVPS